MKTSTVQSANINNCLPIGYRLHEFEIKNVIGEGGFGIVYLAYDHQLDRMLAIKEYMPTSLAKRLDDYSIALREERFQQSFNIGLKSFEQEARALAQFSHPSLVHVFRFWNSNNTSYMAIQRYKGITLKKYRTESPDKINEAWLKKILTPLLGAIDTLHQKNYIHLDIAMDNIMIQPSGLPVLLDFGSAKKAIGHLDNQNEIILKSGYAPIEQYVKNSNELGPWTDIYALGAVLHTLITGSPPPVSMVRYVEDPYIPLTKRGLNNYSFQFLDVIDQMLVVKYEKRTQSIKQLADNMGITVASVTDIISHQKRQDSPLIKAQNLGNHHNKLDTLIATQKQARHIEKLSTDKNIHRLTQQMFNSLYQHNLILEIVTGLALLILFLSYSINSI